jgi:hypothetical protein
MQISWAKRAGQALAWALAGATLLLAAPGAQAAEAPPKLWKKCTTGPAAGHCAIPRGIATSPTTGHLYLADQSNRRIDELTAWGEFVKAWGKGVKNGAPELQVCTGETGCQAGQAGSEGGAYGSFGPEGVAVDSAGGIYVVDTASHRIQKFDSEGHFVLMFGAKVNKTKVEAAAPAAQQNLCPVDPGDVCQAGVTGTGPGEFSDWPISNPTTADPPGSGAKVYVGDQGRIQEFEPNGAFKALFPDPESQLVGKSVKALAVDSTGNLYVAFEGLNVVEKLSSSGAKQCEATVANPLALAINPAGGFYVVERLNSEHSTVRQFGSGCAESGPSFGADELTDTSTGIATGSACYTAGFGLYASSSKGLAGNDFIRAYGPAPDKLGLCPRPPAAPTIASQAVVGFDVQSETQSATVAAQINPHFWDDTTYHVEYGTGRCSEGDCPNEVPVPPEALGGGVSEKELATVPLTLPDLAFGTTYHYRFVAESGGGGPVYGVDPDGEEGPKEASPSEGEERSLRTFDPPQPDCPPACLPDARAYEQVSPPTKNGFDVDRGLIVARPDGGAVLYRSLGAFANPQAGANLSTYLANRDPASWQSAALGPAVDPMQEIVPGQVLGVSGDFGKQLVLTNAKLTPEAVGEDNTAVNIYVHDSATDSYQYVATAHGTSETPLEDVIGFDGFAGASFDGRSLYFTLLQPLAAPPAPPPGILPRLYGFDTASGQLSYLGVLPAGGVDPKGSYPGGATQIPGAQPSIAPHPASTDGSRVYWKDSGAVASPLYLYEGGQSTLVSEKQSDSSAQNARLWGTSADGGLAFLTSDKKLSEDASPAGVDLYRYDADAEALTDLTPDSADVNGAAVQQVLGVSEDGAYAYFIASGNLAAGASGGGAKIYVWHEGEGTRLIGTLASSAGQLASVESPNDLWRVSPDGRYLGFLFGGELEPPGAGAEPFQPWPVREAYFYDYGAASLSCASCPPGGLAGGAVTLQGSRPVNLSSLRTYETGLTRNVTNAGQFFFQSKDRLLLADTNGKQDVYEYSAADHKAHLLSTGQSSADSYFGDATPSGSDAFFTTRESLVGQDQDQLSDLYDARVGGGIPSQNQPPPIPCEPEINCQIPPPPPPPGQGPSTPGLIGPPNPTPLHCKQGSVRKGGKCVKQRHRKKGHRQAKRGGRR